MNTGILVLGVIYAISLLTRSLWSWRLAPVCPYGSAEPAEAAFWSSLAGRLEAVSPALAGWMRSGPTDRESLLLASTLPEVVLTACFLGLLAHLYRNRAHLGVQAVARIRSWGLCFVSLAFVAVPAQVQDFWASIAWGRMVLRGINPYTTAIHPGMDPAIRAGLPLDLDLPGMTYGPLWALLSAALSALGALLPGSAWGEALVFKLFLAGCWVGLILLTDRVLRDRSPWERCFGLAIAGWLPLGPVQAVAEGHNDALVVVLLALWVTGFRGGTLGLVASALCKYVTAPLLLLERPVRWTTAAAATVLTVLSFAPFLRSLDMFDSALRMRTWRYLTLREAGLPWQRVAEGVVGGDWGLLPLAGQLLPVLVAVWFVIRWWGRRADPRRLGQARLAVLLAVMLSGLGHLWPWFVLWALPLAALDPPWWLSRLWLAIALAIPFAFAFVIHGRGLPDLVRFDLSSLALYLGVGACFMILPARWFPARSSGTFPAGTG